MEKAVISMHKLMTHANEARSDFANADLVRHEKYQDFASSINKDLRILSHMSFANYGRFRHRLDEIGASINEFLKENTTGEHLTYERLKALTEETIPQMVDGKVCLPYTSVLDLAKPKHDLTSSNFYKGLTKLSFLASAIENLVKGNLEFKAPREQGKS